MVTFGAASFTMGTAISIYCCDVWRSVAESDYVTRNGVNTGQDAGNPRVVNTDLVQNSMKFMNTGNSVILAEITTIRD